MPVNTIPERLTAFRVYLEGTSDLKGIADIQLPSFEPLKDTIKGAGIAGEYESPTPGHFGSMKLTFNWRTLTKEQLVMLAQKPLKFDCRGAFQDYDAGTSSQVIRKVRIVVQGPTMKVDPGKFETGAGSGGSTEQEVMYIKIEINDQRVVEIDKLNYICIIDGVDYMAPIRAALGL